jgi:Ca-activated chloride channel family protein
MIRPAAAAAAIAALLVAAPSARQAQFRSGASNVAVYATVTNAAGGIVTDLDRDQFEVYDDGEPQTISIFANDVQPITMVMMLDRSISMVGNFQVVARGAREFVDRLLPGDKARIGSFSDRVQVDPREFTSDKRTLRRILETELQPPGPTPLWNAISVGMTALLHQEGRRVVLVFTDGLDQPFGGMHNMTLHDIVKRSEEENVMVYAIGLAATVPYGYNPFPNLGNTGRGAPAPRPTDRPDPGLQTLAAASGGGYFELTRAQDLTLAFARIADELHRQYLLGFVPQKLDGKSHKLEVRLKTNGLKVRARRSFLAAR